MMSHATTELRLPSLFFIAASTPESEFLARTLRPYASLERFITPTLALERMEMIEGNDRIVLPDAIVTYEPRPHAFDGGFSLARTGTVPSTEAIYEKMATMWPLVPRVTIGGAWCEGETRTGYPRRGEIRLEFGEASWALRHELPRLVAGNSRWRFPPTTTDEEWIQMNGLTFPAMGDSVVETVASFVGCRAERHVESERRTAKNDTTTELGEPVGDASVRKIVYVCCEDRALAELLDALARWIGWETCGMVPKELDSLLLRETAPVGPMDSLAKICVDIDSPEISAYFSQIAQNMETVRFPTLLLAAFPRFDELLEWQSMGVQVLPKPFQVAYLFDFLQTW